MSRSNKVKVVLRCRPFLRHEQDHFDSVRVVDDKRVELATPLPGASCLHFAFDACYDDTVTQQQLFENEIASCLPSVLKGINNTVFAYGMTGAGKTHTMQGSESDPGVIMRAAETLMHLLEEQPLQHAVFVSYLEIYNEKVYDLLNPTGDMLDIREDRARNIVIPNLEQQKVTTYEAFVETYAQGCTNRRTAGTNLNSVSSRSHAILILKVVLKDTVNKRKLTGKLQLIDLAGSEDNRLTDNKGMRMTESTNINSSLFVLSNVVTALNTRSARVPYRDSKLTRILHDSLGGKSNAIMIANVAPGYNFYHETTRTLNFASKSKQVVNAPVVHSEKIEEDYRRKLSDWKKLKGAKRVPKTDAVKGVVLDKENAVNGCGTVRAMAAPAQMTVSSDLQKQIDQLVQERLRSKLDQLSLLSPFRKQKAMDGEALSRLAKLEDALSCLQSTAKGVLVRDEDIILDNTDIDDWEPSMAELEEVEEVPEKVVKKKKKKVKKQATETALESLDWVSEVRDALLKRASAAQQEERDQDAERLAVMATMVNESKIQNGDDEAHAALLEYVIIQNCFSDPSLENAEKLARNTARVLYMLNHSTYQELEKELHSIGRKRAQLIVQHRTAIGAFSQLSEIDAILSAKQLSNFIEKNVLLAV